MPKFKKDSIVNIPFGRMLISIKDLYANKLTIRRPDYNATTIHRVPISDDMMLAILDIIENNHLNYEYIQQVNEEELLLFEKMLQLSNLYVSLKYNKRKARDTVKELLNRYRVLVGQIQAGNDNDELLNELKELSYVLYKHGKLSKSQFIDNLKESV
jgi:hypothetical protein